MPRRPRQPRALADLAADLRCARRTLAKDRWFTAGAILTLALAMGVANTTFILRFRVHRVVGDRLRRNLFEPVRVLAGIVITSPLVR